MSYSVLLSDRAAADIETVLRWFSEQRATTAGKRWLATLLDKIDTLEQRPERAALAAEAFVVGQPIREMLLGRGRFKYRILFLVSTDTVHIVRVWHASRDAITRDQL